MPLIHSKKPSAFSKNVSAERHAGKPQNQALAIAYSVKRKAEHKADGGMCGACGGPCKMAKGGEIKGVHEDKMGAGYSSAGAKAEFATEMKRKSQENDNEKGLISSENLMEESRGDHREKLHELRSMPKPKLKGLADGGPVLPGAQDAQDSMRKAFKFEEGGEVDSDDSEMHEMLGPEMMDAIHSKDHKKLMSGIEAMVLHHMSKKGE